MIDEVLKSKAEKVRLLIFDVDGVLTDGSLIFGDDGQEYKVFNARDGHGMKMLIRSGVDIAVITGRTSDVVRHRAANLGIVHVYQGQPDKMPAYENLLNKLGLSSDQTAYVGDDVMDIPVMRRVGLAITVDGAHPLAVEHAHWITPHSGGRGAARDICDMLMQAQGSYERIMEPYLRPST